MNRTTAMLSVAALLLLAGAGAALERGLALSVTRETRETASRELEDALRLAAKHPGAFGAAAFAAPDASLKSLTQDLAAKHGLSIAFLSESEREAERGRPERQVVVRLLHPGHRAVVLFLGELEARGGGACVREIHVRPSTAKADHYEEAEIVVARVATSDRP